MAENFQDGLPVTAPRGTQAPLPVGPRAGKKVSHGLLPTLSLQDFVPVRLETAVQRVDAPGELDKKFQQPVFPGPSREASGVRPVSSPWGKPGGG
jgi:hypothetical protein